MHIQNDDWEFCFIDKAIWQAHAGLKFRISTKPMKTEDSDSAVEPEVVRDADPLAAARGATSGADILYRKKFKETNVQVWRAVDENKNAYEVSFFRPTVNLKAKECALGDVAVRGNAFPNFGHLMVFERKRGALRKGCQYLDSFL